MHIEGKYYPSSPSDPLQTLTSKIKVYLLVIKYEFFYDYNILKSLNMSFKIEKRLTVQNFIKYCKTVVATKRQYNREYNKNSRKNL